VIHASGKVVVSAAPLGARLFVVVFHAAMAAEVSPTGSWWRHFDKDQLPVLVVRAQDVPGGSFSLKRRLFFHMKSYTQLWKNVNSRCLNSDLTAENISSRGGCVRPWVPPVHQQHF
jgi:hypothetical protein